MIRIDPEVSERYGEALFKVAQRQNAIDQLLLEAEALCNLMPRGSNIRTFLEGPQFNTRDQIRVIENTFRDRLHPLMIKLLNLLINRRRIYYLEEVLTVFQRLIAESRNIFPAEVVTAVEMDAEVRSKLTECLEDHTGNQLQIRFHVDPRLIGGVVFKFRDLLIDDSIKNKLDKLRHSMLAVQV